MQSHQDAILSKRKERGVAVIMTSLSLLFIIPIVGLGIDASLLYLAKARLASACDAAALAAARSLNRGLTLAEQEENARNRALAFFDANFPPGYLSSVSRSRSAEVTETSYRLRTVTVTGSTTQPVYFMRLMGHTNIPITASGRANRRDVNLIMVLDRSGSMASSGACEPMKTAARDFLTYFANTRDRLGLIVYNASHFVAVSPVMDFFTAMDTNLANISCSGFTGIGAAVSEAYNRIIAINEPGVLNMIVLFTDGQANAVQADYPVKMLEDTRFGYGVSPYSSTGTTYTVPPSTCRDSSNRQFPTAGWSPGSKTGVMVGGTGNTGNTNGLYQPTLATLTSSEAGITNTSGCTMAGQWTNRYRRDIAFIPNNDSFGNNLACCYRTPSTFATGHVYAGRIRPDRPISIQDAADNSADSLAARVRADTTLAPVIYTIGLGSVDAVLLRRMANDPASPIYDANKQVGMYAYAPDASQLSRAFAQIASEILRISR